MFLKIFSSKKQFFFFVLFFLLYSGFLTFFIFQMSEKQSNPNDTILLMDRKEAKIVFHNLSQDDVKKAENLTREQIRLITSKPQFFPSLEIAQKYEDILSKKATDKNIPEEIAFGMALLENGGSEKEVSSAGAAGILQLTKNTARVLGLTVNDEIDERIAPEKNIEAGLSYLKQNLQLFSDIGLAIWAYHAGPQNVSVALKTYLKSIGEEDAFDFSEAEKLGTLDRAKNVWRAYVVKDGLDIHKLLQNPNVKLFFLPTLSDETELYPYKITASAILYDTAKIYSSKDEFKSQVEKFRQGRILLSDLLNPKVSGF